MCTFGFEECSVHSNARVTGSSYGGFNELYNIHLSVKSEKQDSTGDIDNIELTETSKHMGI